jgi:Transcription factor WhiB
MTAMMSDRAEHYSVTALPAAELERIVHAAERPCAAPGADPEDWFPAEPGSGYQPRARARYESRALALCRDCPVAIECLELAMLREGPQRGHGISGGTTPWQRQEIKASRGWTARRGGAL